MNCCSCHLLLVSCLRTASSFWDNFLKSLFDNNNNSLFSLELESDPCFCVGLFLVSSVCLESSDRCEHTPVEVRPAGHPVPTEEHGRRPLGVRTPPARHGHEGAIHTRQVAARATGAGFERSRDGATQVGVWAEREDVADQQPQTQVRDIMRFILCA